MDVIESALIPLYHTSLLPCNHVAPISVVVQVMEPLSASCPNRCHVVSGWNKHFALILYSSSQETPKDFSGRLFRVTWGGATCTQVKRLIIQFFKAKSQPKHMNFKTVRKSRYEYHVSQFHDVIVESQDSSPTADPPPNRKTNWWLISSVQTPRMPDVDFGVGEKSSLKTCITVIL